MATKSPTTKSPAGKPTGDALAEIIARSTKQRMIKRASSRRAEAQALSNFRGPGDPPHKRY